MKNNKGQVSVFIIIAVVIVAATTVYILTRGSFGGSSIPAEIQPAYTSFLSCIEQRTLTGISLLQSQGGYIDYPNFESGSSYMPFSSHLDFYGNKIPYWYYVSGNGIPKENVPTLKEMEKQLADYVSSRATECDFKDYYDQGFQIYVSGPKAESTIKNGVVQVNLDADVEMSYGDETFLADSHEILVSSQLGDLYNSARKIYEEEQKTLFLEQRAVDNLRNYAPVDGVEISCSPLFWNADKIFDDLQYANEANTVAIGISKDKYFNPSFDSSFGVRFLNSKNWPHAYEVVPTEDDSQILVAEPVGNQQGMGILGFCYVPYHFVYNIRYPVLVQVYSEDETFQFPLAVVIENNNPRVSLNATAVEDVVPELCTYKNSDVDIEVSGMEGNSIKANISYECFGNRCQIGETSRDGVLEGKFPQCVNGYVMVTAEGYRDKRYLFSTVSGGSATIFMQKEYEKEIELKLDGKDYNGEAVISFISDDQVQNVAYPYQKTVKISEGQYEIKVSIYRNSSITIGATTTQQCIKTVRGGVLGVLGLQEKKCFDIQIPEQIVSNALAGGGNLNYYVIDSDLEKSRKIEIDSESLPVPDSIKALQNNYILFDENKVEVDFI